MWFESWSLKPKLPLKTILREVRADIMTLKLALNIFVADSWRNLTIHEMPRFRPRSHKCIFTFLVSPSITSASQIERHLLNSDRKMAVLVLMKITRFVWWNYQGFLKKVVVHLSLLNWMIVSTWGRANDLRIQTKDIVVFTWCPLHARNFQIKISIYQVRLFSVLLKFSCLQVR